MGELSQKPHHHASVEPNKQGRMYPAKLLGIQLKGDILSRITFDDVSKNGVTMVANQGNNLYVFPPGLGSILVEVTTSAMEC